MDRGASCTLLALKALFVPHRAFKLGLLSRKNMAGDNELFLELLSSEKNVQVTPRKQDPVPQLGVPLPLTRLERSRTA